MAGETTGTPIGDPTVLRAIAHPVRNRVLAELYAAGPMRAADVAEAIDVPANQASFHLRQLAKYGLVEEAPELARDGRDRVWRPVHEHGLNVSLDNLEQAPGGRAAVTVFRRQSIAHAQEFVARAFASSGGPDRHVMISDSSVRLTVDEARQLGAELAELVEGWRGRTQGASTGERRTYEFIAILQPADPDPEDPSDARA
ncbi:helix-turn-helix domain-containing protein [Nocardioides terrisoli]|uniref:helix-turn-helix domain-containing protein n=1 Tax=Nocardioides terrisoli TaxID=3388267 RepID=UPI00287BA644|nr:helix-turn-helix domain-containing protein [Nocardioides marmorisolisilvae]